MQTQATATAIVGPTTLLRESLVKLLTPAGFRIVASEPSLKDVNLENFAVDQAGLLVIESGECPKSVIAEVAEIRQVNAAVRIVLVRHHWTPAEIGAAFEAGVNACFAEVTDSAEFLKAIELVMLGHQTLVSVEVMPTFVAAIPTSEQPAPLSLSFGSVQSGVVGGPIIHFSPRESGILRCLAHGASNKLIAREINISEATVKVHVKAILRKIGAANRTQAAVWAMTNGYSNTEEPPPEKLPSALPSSSYSQIEHAEPDKAGEASEGS